MIKAITEGRVFGSGLPSPIFLKIEKF